MTAEEIFDSVVRSSGDLAGVFESDSETAYFYLYQNSANDQRVLDAIHITSNEFDFCEDDIAIRWSEYEERVGLFIKNKLWAVFDTVDSRKYGGEYTPSGNPALPADMSRQFVRTLSSFN